MRIMTGKKTIEPSPRNQDKKNVKVDNKKVNKITEIKELIDAGTKLVSDKMGNDLWNPNSNTKLGWEIWLERQVKRLQQQTKMLKKVKHAGICSEKKNQTSLPRRLEQINQNILTEKTARRGQGIQMKRVFQNKEIKIYQQVSWECAKLY